MKPLLLLAVAALSAANQDQGPRFEIASIKPSKPGAVVQDVRIFFPPGRFEALNVTLDDILLSFSGFSGKVQGGPKWVETERYDIAAKAESDIAPGQRGAMVMALLEDRFKLAIHREAREVPGLALAVGKKPPKLDPSKDGEETMIRSGDRRQVVFQNVNMFRLVNYLSQMWHTTVADRTGIKGNFDFSLDPDSFAAGDSFGNRIRSAVEGLGFVVETQKVTLDITVIDHAERPGEN